MSKNGHGICYHCNNHWPYAYLSYAQFTNEVASARGFFSANNYDSSTWVYAYGSTNYEQGKWFKNNGFKAGFITANAPISYGMNQFKLRRLGLYDNVDFSVYEEALNIE